MFDHVHGRLVDGFASTPHPSRKPRIGKRPLPNTRATSCRWGRCYARCLCSLFGLQVHHQAGAAGCCGSGGGGWGGVCFRLLSLSSASLPVP